MKTLQLLPHRFQALGWTLFLSGLAIGLVALTINDHWLGLRLNVLSFFGDALGGDGQYFKIIRAEMTLTLAGVLAITGGLLLAFTREKFEDEFIAQLRLSSFQWAVLANYMLLLLAFLGVYGLPFLAVLPYNMFTVIVLFVVRFRYLLYKNRLLACHEE